MSDLIKRLEAATGPDRKLDCALMKFAGWTSQRITDPITGQE